MNVRLVKKGTGPDSVAWFQGIVKNIEDGAQRGLEEVSSSGETQVKGFITSRGARTSGPRGRYDTGEMYSKVGSKTSTHVSNFGWINGSKPYFVLQEGGFTHVNSGQWIEGMYAITDSADNTFQQFKAHMDQVVRDA